MNNVTRELINYLWLPILTFDIIIVLLFKSTHFYSWLLGKAGEFHVKNELKKLPAHYITLAKYQDTIIDHPETIANAIQQLNITDPQARRQHKQSLKVSHSKN